MKTSILLSTLLLEFVTAAAVLDISPRTTKSTPRLATFDDLKAVPAVSVLSPIGSYEGLDYNSLNLLQAGVPVVNVLPTGLLPQSGSQGAANGIITGLTQGGPSLTISGTTISFDLIYLYFGCLINSVSTITGVPEQCTLAFTAYKKGKSSTPFQTVNFQFNPTNPLRSKMTKAEFPKSWTGLDRVDIALVQATTTSAASGFLLDNVAYTTYST